jgi:hypothetical protein
MCHVALVGSQFQIFIVKDLLTDTVQEVLVVRYDQQCLFPLL